MHASKYHLYTLKETPAEAEIISHQLMLRAGMIRKLAGGIYNLMPLGMRVLQKIEKIVRDEMNNSGALEILMPIVQPAELWQESGRLEKYGPELLRIRDRHDRCFILQPTSEEVVSDIARNEIHSHKQLPVLFYHIQTKFRDEVRPRFGMLRSREFIMKDAYSFDKNEEDALKSYQSMFDAYSKIFEKISLKFCAVLADTGSIGGSYSNEFHVLADKGEDLIAYDKNSTYASNLELAEAPCLIKNRENPKETMEITYTPNTTTCEKVAELLNTSITNTIKSIVLFSENKNHSPIYLLLIRGDHSLNEIKTRKISGLENYRFATQEEIMEYFGCKPGYLGPINILKPVNIIVDKTVMNMSDFICGANKENYHYKGVNWGVNIKEPDIVLDIRNVVEGDPLPNGTGTFSIQRGIEVGHIFFLGTKYSKDLNACFLNDDGKYLPLQMGCYGIGITRIMAAAIEQNNDQYGIIWPKSIAPFEVVICPINWKNEQVKHISMEIYKSLKTKNIDVILDDRNNRPGVMFSEWDLIGIPLKIVIGPKDLENNLIEIKTRKDHNCSVKTPINLATQEIIRILEQL
ncbi:prolyl-tRNA synthetase [Candidatus Kinetoplastibacterium desouzaii TCC079E]|uniref:Proline--tRNA ligase n=1 Tax=Candidatus Kinetoplastidibacterium desouzai TCC079E TaxID=1208919 RepID=M1L303_9PROT|nr:proline--tRNA ligase [Candidatus Kinetoplastibacterium desouzaii]AGF47133.1 prolyl-tRNA synthetase [Candidatus Kinetoplastibacterium desouzaii TCC079E]